MNCHYSNLIEGHNTAPHDIERAGRLLLWEPPCEHCAPSRRTSPLLVDAKDDRAVEFYRHHGFVSFLTNPRVLFLPLATAAKVLDRSAPAVDAP